MPPHKNTHFQTAQSHIADQGLQASIFYPNPAISKTKPPFLQKIKIYSIDRQRHRRFLQQGVLQQTFGPEWESGAKEYMNNPKFLKHGKTTLGNLETFWFDYSTSNPQLYSKNYQTKKGARLYTITLTCPENEYTYYSSIWFRFKDKFNFE